MLCVGRKWLGDKYWLVIGFVCAAFLLFWAELLKPTGGLVVKYYSNDTYSPPIETSWQYNSDRFTRIDYNVDFHPVGFSWIKNSFPLAFANDVRRRVWSPNQTGGKYEYAFSAIWSGYINVGEHEAKL